MANNPNYDVIVRGNKQDFQYKDCEVQDVILKQYQELPQSLKWSSPKFSEDGKYFGAIGKGKNEDYVFIWEKNNSEKYLYTYKMNNIYGFEFAPNSKSFVIIYEKSNLIHYNITSGHQILEFNTKDVNIEHALTFAFSPKSRYFAIATKTAFIIWDVLNGNMIQKMDDDGSSKYIRKDLLVSISQNGRIKMIQFKELKVLKELTLEKVTNCNQILNCMLTPNMLYFYYILKDGIYKIEISSGETSLVQPFDTENIQLALISFDCKDSITSNNELIDFWNEDQGKTGTIAKERFHYMSVHFKYHQLITIDDICINITDTSNPDIDELFVWTNLNPISFDQYTFSPDSSIILAYINEHRAAIYNTVTGKIIKQWYNELRNWSQSCQLVPKKSETAIISTKSTNNCVKIWNYNNGNEYMSLYGFNCFMTNFSQEGNIVCAGGVAGDEIARVWELDSGDHKSYMNQGHDNRNSYAYITTEATYLIAQAVYQPPIVYDLETTQMLFKCQSVIRFKQINSIKASQDNKYFYCHGQLTSDNSPSAVIYSLENKEPIEEINHCTSIDISENANYLLVKLKKGDNEGTLKQYDLKNKFKFIQFGDKSEFSSFLQDNNTVASSYGDETKTIFFLYSTDGGKPCGEIDYIKKAQKFSQVEISASNDKGLIIRNISYE